MTAQQFCETPATSRNYIINTSSTEKEIDLSSYAAGYYSVGLVCDGELVETLNLIKQ